MQKIVLNNKVIFYKVGNKNITDKYSLLKALAKEAVSLDLVIEKKNNKPHISNHKDLFCSVSDSKDVIFVALCEDFQIGVDVEFLRPRKKDLLEYCCNENELRILKEIYKKPINLETVMWSLKESVQKSDQIISEPKYYIVISSEKNTLNVKKDDSVWISSMFERDGYIFSISLKTTN